MSSRITLLSSVMLPITSRTLQLLTPSLHQRGTWNVWEVIASSTEEIRVQLHLTWLISVDTSICQPLIFPQMKSTETSLILGRRPADKGKIPGSGEHLERNLTQIEYAVCMCVCVRERRESYLAGIRFVSFSEHFGPVIVQIQIC